MLQGQQAEVTLGTNSPSPVARAGDGAEEQREPRPLLAV